MQPSSLLVDPHADNCSAGKPGTVVSVDIAGSKAMGAAVAVAGREALPLLEAAGRITAAAVASPIDLPPFANSAMDGYAVRTADFVEPGPWRLPVSGRIPAGAGAGGTYPRFSALRIFTGAAMPGGFDAVVMQEHCEPGDGNVLFRQRPRCGQNVRKAGEDVARGAVAIPAGSMLSPARVALLAAIGVETVDVRRKVRIGLISTGSELREPGRPLGPGQIYNSNRYFLRAALQLAWAESFDFGIVPDDPEAIRAAIGEAARACDIVITTGGVSAGEEDHMLEVLRRENARLEVLKVAMRPGKPVTVGKIGGALYFGLPGNPYATAVTFTRIALPAIRATAGLAASAPCWTPAVAGFSYSRKPGRTEYVPVTWSRRDGSGRPVVEMLGRGSSASLFPMAVAMATAELAPEAGQIEPGTELRIEPLCGHF